jgi:hypothetical protein
MKLNYFQPCKNIDELKFMYRSLCKLHHPDRGGDVKTMQAVNAEYAYICQNLKDFFVCENEEQTVQDLKIFAEIIEKIEMLPVEIEVIGSWLWISGNTYPHRQILKDVGLMFALKKKLWYYRPEEFKSSNFRPLEMDEIRHKYGSTKIENKFKPQLNQ